MLWDGSYCVAGYIAPRHLKALKKLHTTEVWILMTSLGLWILLSRSRVFTEFEHEAEEDQKIKRRFKTWLCERITTQLLTFTSHMKYGKNGIEDLEKLLVWVHMT